MEALLHWSKEIKQKAIEYRGKAAKFVDQNKLNNKSKNVMYLRDWVRSIQYYMKNAKEIQSKDIRKYLKLIKKGWRK